MWRVVRVTEAPGGHFYTLLLSNLALDEERGRDVGALQPQDPDGGSVLLLPQERSHHCKGEWQRGQVSECGWMPVCVCVCVSFTPSLTFSLLLLLSWVLLLSVAEESGVSGQQ